MTRIHLSDDPDVVLLALKIVEAITRNDSAGLETVLREASDAGKAFQVELSLAALATELLKTLPNWENRLQEWMLGTEMEIPSPKEES